MFVRQDTRGKRRRHIARSHCIDANTPVSPLTSKRPRELVDRGLRRPVSSQPRTSDHTKDTGDEDDDAPCCEQRARCSMADVERANGVDLLDKRERFRIVLLGAGAQGRYASGMNQNIQASGPASRVFDGSNARLVRGDVAFESERPAANAARSDLALVDGARRDGDNCPQAGKSLRNTAADTSTTSGDEARLAIQTPVGAPSHD